MLHIRVIYINPGIKVPFPVISVLTTIELSHIAWNKINKKAKSKEKSLLFSSHAKLKLNNTLSLFDKMKFEFL